MYPISNIQKIIIASNALIVDMWYGALLCEYNLIGNKGHNVSSYKVIYQDGIRRRALT